MGLYMYVSEEDRISKRKVSDEYINEEFQEALKYDPSLMIEAYPHIKKVRTGLFKSQMVDDTRYNIYHETPCTSGAPYQARLQGSGSGGKEIVIAYLHGIINGAVHNSNKNNFLTQS